MNTGVVAVLLTMIGLSLGLSSIPIFVLSQRRARGFTCAAMGVALFASGMYLIAHEQTVQRQNCDSADGVFLQSKAGERICITVVDGVLKEIEVTE